ncbi:cytochrome c [Hyphomicrobium sp. CS1GBMeth3]|uniref:c-type cytochrome n=1 Tax=Hyphomicrobium sp. CS1GBMeth3 TaxID=1892845 RepID=UPI000930C4C8|nr:cytochrome c [Hyphomicrobium sp. CS1GBMeth3]
MWISRGLVLLGLLMLAAPSVAGSATPKPDPEKGRALAERVCTACHVISKHPASSVAADVPSFPAIANKPGQSMETIAGRIVIPHPPMPAVALTREEIVNVVAYIMTFKERSETGE